MATEKHKQSFQSTSGSKITSFFTRATESSEKIKEVAAAEGTFIYHTVKHAHSYLSANCSSNLFFTMFPDSQIAQKYSCGRTKATKIVQNVLAPAAREIVLNDLLNCKYFSIGTDASNKGNIKTFPLTLRYFSSREGVTSKLLCFFSLDSETSKDISNALIAELQKYGLSVGNITAYSADNAAVNFGKNQSVFVELKKHNPNLIPMGCNCHILHNMMKRSHSLLTFDLEYIIVKCYNEFSSSTKKTAELKKIFDWCELDWSELLRHVSTRWLSLIPALERLLKNFPAIKSYFLTCESTSPILKKFFEHELAEAYLAFVANVGGTICSNIKKLETDNFLALDLYNIMKSIRTSLRDRLEQHFYGFVAQNLLRKCSNDSANIIFKKEADAFLEKCIFYLEKWFDFDNHKYKNLSVFNLNHVPSFDDFQIIINDFNLGPNIDVDVLFDEFCVLKEYVKQKIEDDKFKSLSSDKKWVDFFKNNSAKNFETLSNFIFSLPHSNADSERIFSLMFNAWRKDRNKAALKTVESELLIKYNFAFTCTDFKKFLLSKDGDSVLQKIKQSEKYS